MTRKYNWAREWLADNYDVAFPNSDGGLTVFAGYKPWPDQFTSIHQYFIAISIYKKRSFLLKTAYHANFNKQYNIQLRMLDDN